MRFEAFDRDSDTAIAQADDERLIPMIHLMRGYGLQLSAFPEAT
jgi:hypothetical protein